MNNKTRISLWNDNRWHPLTELRREMDRLFDDNWLTPTVAHTQQTGTQFAPACDIEEEENHFLLALEMPGISKDDLKIEVIENQIVISGERRNERKNKENGAWYSERQYGKVSRSFNIPTGVDAEKIEANYQDGILRLIIPKVESIKPRQIKINQDSKNGFFDKLLNQTKSEKEIPSNDRKSEKVA